MDREPFAVTIGVAAGLAGAAGAAYLMYADATGHGLPAGRYPIVLLVLIFVGPPVIAGLVVGFAALMAADRLLKPLEDGLRERENQKRYRNRDLIWEAVSRASTGNLDQVLDREIMPIMRQQSWKLDDDIVGKHYDGFALLHMAAVTGNFALIEAIAARAPVKIGADASKPRRHFHEAALNGRSDEALAAFGRGYQKAIEAKLPAQERPLAEDERQYVAVAVEAHIRKMSREEYSFRLNADVLAPIYVGAARHDMAEWLYNQGRGEEGLPLIESAIRLRPEKAEYYIMRGRIHRMMKNLDLALRDFDQAIRHAPKNAEAYYRRAGARADASRLAEAELDYNKAIELDANYVGAYVDRGVLFCELLGYAALGIADFRRALAIDPAFAIARENLDAVLKREKADEATIAELTSLLEKEPENADALSRRGHAYRIAGDPVKATADLEAAIRLAPNDVMPLLERLRLRRDADEFASARTDGEQLEIMAPNEAWPLTTTAWLCERLGDRNAAIERYRKALLLEPENANSLAALKRLGVATNA